MAIAVILRLETLFIGLDNGSISWRNSGAMLETKVYQARTATAADFLNKKIRKIVAGISPKIRILLS